MNRTQIHTFDLDEDNIRQIIEDLGATEKQMKAAWNRAIRRTGVTMRARALRLVRDDVKSKNIAGLKQRFGTFFLSKKSGMQELKLWFGLNDIRVSLLKGRASHLGTRRKRKGAKYTRATGHVIEKREGFLSTAFRKRTIWYRSGKRNFPIHELEAPINEHLQWKIEDDVFQDLPDVFMKNFTDDLQARVKYRIRGYGR